MIDREHEVGGALEWQETGSGWAHGTSWRCSCVCGKRPQLVSVETARNVDALVAHDPHPPAQEYYLVTMIP